MPTGSRLNFISPTSSPPTTRGSSANSSGFTSRPSLPQGRRNQAAAVQNDLVRSVVDSKPVYNLAKAFMSKNHQGGLIRSNHVSVGCIQDPIQVEALDLYLSKLHPSLDRFFQRAKVPPGTTLNDSHSHWYVNSPISHNLLNQFMKRISEQAHLSTQYTNHCLQATIVHLKEAGVEDRKICEISGHKNPASLTAYDLTSAERAVDLSAAIDTKRVAPAPANPPSPLSDITNSPSASGFLFNAGNATFNNVTFNFAPPPPKKRKVSRERLQLKKTRERLLQSRTAEGEFSTAERTTVELSGSTS